MNLISAYTFTRGPAPTGRLLGLAATPWRVLTAGGRRECRASQPGAHPPGSPGLLERIGAGAVPTARQPVTEHHGLAVASARARTVICLLSALAFTASARSFLRGVDRDRPPGAASPGSQSRYASCASAGRRSREGDRDTRAIEGASVRVYGVRQDPRGLFKYRNKIGLDVALEALREAWRERKFTMDEIDRYARICRVERVMRPYLEAWSDEPPAAWRSRCRSGSCVTPGPRRRSEPRARPLRHRALALPPFAFAATRSASC